MEDGVAGPRLGEAAEAVGARAPPRVTLRPFAPFYAAAAEADEGGGDWSFIDCEMEEVDLQDLPSATIACHLDPRVFVDGLCRVRTVRPSGRRADTCCGARPGLHTDRSPAPAGVRWPRRRASSCTASRAPDRVPPARSSCEIGSS